MITVNANDLQSLLRDGAESAGQDESLPMLTGTILHVDGDRLYATSTDRYCLAQTWIRLANDHITEDTEESLGASVAVLPPAGVRMVLQLLSDAYPAAVADMSVSEEFRSLRVTMRYENAQVAVPLMETDYPHVGRLFAELDETRQSGAGTTDLNAKLVARMVAIAKRRREPLRFEFGEANKVTVIHIGEQCRMLAAPIRLHEPPGEWRWSSPPRPVEPLRSVKR